VLALPTSSATLPNVKLSFSEHPNLSTAHCSVAAMIRKARSIVFMAKVFARSGPSWLKAASKVMKKENSLKDSIFGWSLPLRPWASAPGG